MKVKRFLASSVKAALAQVKERLGADAVILSNRATPDGVEVLAIAERDMANVSAPDDAALEAAAPPEGFTASFRRANADDADDAGFDAPSRDVSKPMRTAEALVRRHGGEALSRRAPLETEEAAPVRRATADDFARRVPGEEARREAPAPSPAATAHPPRHFTTPNAEVRPISFADLVRSPQRPAARGVASQDADERPARGAMNRAAAPAATRAQALPPEEVLAELRALRGLMEERFTTLTWSEQIRRRPVAAALMRQLLAAGFSTSLARAATNALPADFAALEAMDWLKDKLIGKLRPVTAADECVERGGVYALTGPTGVGKTTTAAKIAARAAMRYGAQHLGLVTTDTYRIGAHDQLRVFGKILGVPVHAVHDALGLEQTLAQLQGKRLVLIDTIGLGQRDERVSEQQAMLDACNVERLLLLSATSQLETLEDVIGAYMHGPDGVRRAGGVVVTKTDEGVKLGSVVDVLVRHKLPLHFLGTGQRVPEDLLLPDVRWLVDEALRIREDGPFSPTGEEAGLMAMGAALDTMFMAEAHA